MLERRRGLRSAARHGDEAIDPRSATPERRGGSAAYAAPGAGTDTRGGARAASSSARKRRGRRLALLGIVAALGTGAVALVVVEMRTSRLQARYLSSIASELTYHVEDGPSESIRFPGAGPYDLRYGYTRLPEIIASLEERGFSVVRQARISERLASLMDRGIFPIYPAKSQAGLTLVDRAGEPIYGFAYPERVYPDFSAIPPVVWQTLLYIENRELLDARYPYRNPTIDWSRLARAGIEYGLSRFDPGRNVPGASTLATQLEKFRHSPAGRTESPRDKLLQMASASLRAYRDGPETLEAQRRIIVDYLNSMPLAGIAGLGEVTGLGDGLWAWFGADFDEVNRLLFGGDVVAADGAESDVTGGAGGESELAADEGARARAYRQVLLLLLAIQRPSYYLADAEGRAALERRARHFLELLARDGVITPAFRDSVLAVDAPIRDRAPEQLRPSFVERKAANSARTELLSLTGVNQLYALDRIDATARTTFARAVQDSVQALIQRLRDPAFVRAQGLDAYRLLDRGDPAGVYYAFVLHERGEAGNLVRVQADNFDGPFSLVEGGKLELGSTAKLRTLITYLEIVEALYREYAGRPASELRAVEVGDGDRITEWALAWLAAHPDGTLDQILDAAMSRRYSASPAERFFTGGGVHTFSNFDATHNNQVLTVREAFRHSVNLPFIRMMRDIVHYYIHRLPGSPAQALSNRDDPRRQELLARFADREGQVFLGQFYERHREKTPDASLDAMVSARSLTPQRLAWAFRSVLPEAPLPEFADFVRKHAGVVGLSDARIEELYRMADPTPHPLVDLGYLAGVHPLEIWLVRYLIENPGATRAEVMEASRQVRQDVYRWLFATRRTAAQDQRIRSILEAEAFVEIHKAWRRVGYPFESLVPSYATAIGSSADRPDQLAELVGVILNDGVRYPTTRVTEIHFAAGTPYETVLRRDPAPGERVLSPEIARVVREAMLDVVEFGTARRAFGAVRGPDGQPIPIGAKTGTGNNRYRVYGQGGRLIEDRAINRTSTLVFFIGDRFYGTLTVFVPGPQADDYGFTSSLPAQILRMIGPLLEPLFAEGASDPAGSAAEPGGAVAAAAG